ncbi:amino acid adenylation domain-containing protein [Streptomyces actinomycinicus]|uniref:Amino acid adenylation domain-containing protein n=1 Tax=Streptomyces actinomycinicus TaxID=1695166 RepID=A0A937JKN6_9ACTN|nr:non-ribosomal peptide synthetase [Streptomyces actinomycinicus]MBL1082719.1 amino acid adenylation domain-containing protein [Streptomyces actinomycinicus]
MSREDLFPAGGATVTAPGAVVVPPARAAVLRHLAGDDPTGLHLLLIAATRLAMARFGAAKDLAVLCPAPGMSSGEVLLRTVLGPDTKVSDFLQELHRDLAEASALPWQDRAALIARLDAVGEADGSAVAQLAVAWGEAQLTAPAEMLVHGQLAADGGIRLQVVGSDGKVPAVGADLPRCLAATLDAIAADPYRTAAEIDPLSPGQRAELEAWSGLPLLAAFPPRTLTDLADASAGRWPDRVAVVESGLSWTHGELATRSHRVARHLTDKYGIRPGDRVAVAVPRGGDLILATLAVLRAGAVYVPIDPRHPAARVQHLIDSSAACLVIGDVTTGDSRLPVLSALELRAASEAAGEPAAASPLPGPRPQDDAVVFFTSGSTGLPKPVVLRHDQIAHHVVMSADLLGVDESLRCALLSAISADPTAFQIFLAVAVGGALVAIGAPDELDPLTFWDRIREYEVTMVNCVPSLLSTMLEVLPPDAGLELPYLVLGSDTIPRGLLDRTRGRLRIGTFVNVYGPTETTMSCTTFHCSGGEAVSLSAVPIGRPNPGFGVLVLTSSGDLAPVGVPGEIYVVGPAVAAGGYLGVPEATAMRFVDCPIPGLGRAFRTGDLARWNVEGTLHFLGRNDDQVKLHGNRVEPGEVEQTLVGLDGVREAVVLPRPVGVNGVVLGAWYTADGDVEPETVRAALAELLPAHMVPRLLRQVGELPRTPHGKIDRLALATESAPEAEGTWIPVDDADHAVAAAWETVFGHPPQSADEDFFEAGGHSLTAAQLVGVLCTDPAAQGLSIRQVFSARSPRALAEALREMPARDPEPNPTGTPAPAGGRPSRWPATNAQARLWLLESLDEEEVRTYNMVEAYQLTRALDPAALEAAVGYLTDRHEALRTVFEMSAEQGSSELWQVVRPAGRLRVRPRLQRVSPDTFDEALAKARAEEARWRFDLAAGPLFRLRCLTTTGRPPVLLLNVHHAVNDAWSYSVLMHDLLTAARAFERGERPRLPEVAGYVAHAAALDTRLSGSQGEEHARYWRAALADLPPAPALPGDLVPGPRRTNAGGFARVVLDERATEGVRALAVRTGATPFMVYTAAVRALLYRLTGAVDMSLGTVSAGRPTPDLAHEAGLFVNTVVLRTVLNPSAGFSRLVEDCVRTALDAQEHEEYPFDRLVRDLGLPRDQGRNPLFDVLVETVVSGTAGMAPSDGGETVHHLPADDQVSDFDLSFSFLIPPPASSECAEVWVGHRRDLFTWECATQLGERLGALLTELLAAPDAPLTAAP